MGAKTDITQPNPTDIQWIYNHEKIMDAWTEILSDTGKGPTAVATAEKVGITRQAVSNHLLRMKFDKDVTPRHMMNLDSALDKLYALGIEGDTKALVEFIKLVGNPSQKKEVSQNITNKTLRVSFTGKDKENMEKTEEVEFEEITNE